jgi:hypothetical protein
MSLRRVKLTDVISVTGINTVGIFTSGTTQTSAGTAGTTYVKSVVMHNAGIASCTSSLYVYPSVASHSPGDLGNEYYRMARIELAGNETFFYELNYPLVLESGDRLVAEVNSTVLGGSGIGTVVNYQVCGDTDIA